MFRSANCVTGSAGYLRPEADGIWRGIWLEEAHHSTAIEGNTLVLKQVEQLLEQGRAVGNKELREYMEVRGYADAANWVYGQALDPGAWSSGELLSLTELRHIHRLALTPAWDVAPHPSAGDSERPGSFREHDIWPFPGGMRPPPWPEVTAMVTDWIGEVQALGREREGIGPKRWPRCMRASSRSIHSSTATGAPAGSS